jgi:ABC-2 type transport system ATP-binding protein
VRTPDVRRLAHALVDANIDFTDSAASGTHDALRVDADAELVGQIALQAGVPLVELRAADGAGLEEMFLDLTADTQRDDTSEGAAA